MTLQLAPKSAAQWLSALAAVLFVVCSAVVAETPKKQFDLPADVAARSLKTFAQQSGVEVLIRAELGREIRTRPVKGEMTSREAIDAMLRDTGLMAEVDEKNGVFAVRQKPAAEKKARRRRSRQQAIARQANTT